MQNSFFMQQAINEALKADPNKVYPNPLVGCVIVKNDKICLLYTSPSPRDAHESRMPSSA